MEGQIFTFDIGPDDEVRGDRAMEAGFPLHVSDSIVAAEMLHDFQGLSPVELGTRLGELSVLLCAYADGTIEDDEAWKDLVQRQHDALLRHHQLAQD